MIELTPLDVRKKKGDFRKQMRGYDPSEVDTFLDLAAERLEALVKENLSLGERVKRLEKEVSALSQRERAVNEALVTAQELRADIRGHAEKEAELLHRQAETDARRIMEDVERRAEERQQALLELDRRRQRFLASFRQLLERELDAVAVEEGRTPLEDSAVDLDLGGGRAWDARPPGPAAEVSVPAEVTPPDPEADVHGLAAAATAEHPDDDEAAGASADAPAPSEPFESAASDPAAAPDTAAERWMDLAEDEGERRGD